MNEPQTSHTAEPSESHSNTCSNTCFYNNLLIFSIKRSGEKKASLPDSLKDQFSSCLSIHLFTCVCHASFFLRPLLSFLATLVSGRGRLFNKCWCSELYCWVVVVVVFCNSVDKSQFQSNLFCHH